MTNLRSAVRVRTVAGRTLGGGLSRFGGEHGWAADSVTAFEVVEAEGRHARVTAHSDPDRYWALRGGGGDYAVVTALEFDLQPAPASAAGVCSGRAGARPTARTVRWPSPAPSTCSPASHHT